MPECLFNFEFGGEASKLLPGIKRDIAAKGGWVQGDANSGTAMVPSPVGDVEFSYQIAGQHLVVEVTDKPFVVGCDDIEAELRKVIPKPTGAQPISTPANVIYGKPQVVSLEQGVTTYDFDYEPAKVKGTSGAATWPVALVLGLAAGVATWSLLKGKFS